MSARKLKTPKITANRRRSRIKILLVDNDLYVREGVRSCLRRRRHFEVIGEAASGTDAIASVLKLHPDVIIMSVSLPGIDGLETTSLLRESCPQARVLILDSQRNKETVKKVVRSGAPGYVSKNASPAELMAAIECIHRGQTFFTPDIAQEFFDDFVQNGGHFREVDPKLSAREREVLQFIVEGFPNKQVAERLKLSVRTVEKHRQRVMRKVGARRATELVKIAVTRGWVDLAGPR